MRQGFELRAIYAPWEHLPRTLEWHHAEAVKVEEWPSIWVLRVALFVPLGQAAQVERQSWSQPVTGGPARFLAQSWLAHTAHAKAKTETSRYAQKGVVVVCAECVNPNISSTNPDAENVGCHINYFTRPSSSSLSECYSSLRLLPGFDSRTLRRARKDGASLPLRSSCCVQWMCNGVKLHGSQPP